MTTIKVNPLNVGTIRRAIQELGQYKARLKRFTLAYINDLKDAFDEYLYSNAPDVAKDMWEVSDVLVEGNTAKCIFTFDGEVEFIEFGTGFVGLQNHEGINEEWLSKLPPPYNVGWNTGKKIIHVSIPKGDNSPQGAYDYWIYHDGQQFVRTSGIPADPFMYRAVNKLWEMYGEIGVDTFRRTY